MLFGGFRFVLCFCWLLLPSWTSRGFEAQPNSPHADDLASKRPYLEICFRIQINFERWCMVLLFYFYMGSPSMRFIKCCRWPKMICKLFASLRRTSSFYYYLTTCFDYVFSVTGIFFLEGREYIILVIVCFKYMVIYHRRGLLCNGMLRIRACGGVSFVSSSSSVSSSIIASVSLIVKLSGRLSIDAIPSRCRIYSMRIAPSVNNAVSGRDEL